MSDETVVVRFGGNFIRYVAFKVDGIPAPAGSKRGFVNRRTGGVIITDASKRAKPWQARVAAAASEAMSGELLAGPLELTLTFTFPRLPSHFGTGRNAGSLRASAPALPAVRPDVTKLVRAVEDALTGIVWRDDAQVIAQHAYKGYGASAGCEIEVRSLEPAEAS